jgi:hypothetical protein
MCTKQKLLVQVGFEIRVDIHFLHSSSGIELKEID